MKYINLILTMTVLAVGLLGVLPNAAWAQTAEQIEQMRAAMPTQARVTPEQPRKLLIFCLCKGYQHEAVPFGAKVLEMMGDQTGAYTSVVSDDIAMFEPQNLAQFDAVCFNNTTGSLFLPQDIDKLSPEEQAAARAYDAKLKQSLLEFVRSGKGVIGIHAATDAFYEWPEYGEMMGGFFSGHPWNEDVTVQVEDPLNALSAAFDAPTFTIADEIYQFRDPYSRKNLRILLSLDVTKTNMDKGDAIQRTDGDFAVAWIRDYGKGRVYYCSLGHRPEVFMNPMILQFYLDGIQFAMGDLAADATPSATLPAEYVKQEAEARQALALNQALRSIAKLEYGDGVEAARAVENAIHRAHGDADATAAVATRLAETLAQDGVTPAGKRFLAEQLSLCATEQQMGVLVSMLKNSETADLGRFGLERIPGDDVDEALCAALKGASEVEQIGIANTLGKRGNPEAIPALDTLMHATASKDVAHASAAALGKIGGKKALRALNKMNVANDPEYADACLVAASKLLQAGKTRQAAREYKRLLDTTELPTVRWAAFVGMVTAKGTKAVPTIISGFESTDPELRLAANHCVREVGGEKATEAFSARLPHLAPKTQALLITALSDRDDPVAQQAVLAMLDSSDAEVRLAAIKALANLGDAAAVMPLATVAATASGSERDEARKSLSLLRSAEVNDAIMSAIAGAEPGVQAELIRSTVPRYAEKAVPVLLESAKADDKDVRAESYKALAVLAQPDQLPQLLTLLIGMQGDNGRKDAEKAISLVARKATPESAQADPILARLSSVSDANARSSLLNVLGQIGGASALQAVRAALTDSDGAVREAAARTLIAWPDTAPLEDLLTLAKTADTETLQILCLRGALRMLAQDNELSGKPTFRQSRSLAEDLALYKRAMNLATRPEEKKLVLAGVANVTIPASAQYVKTFTSDPALRAEAEQALEKLNHPTKQAYACYNGVNANNILDGDFGTYWDTQTTQVPGMWVMVDLGQAKTVRKLVVYSPGYPPNHAREYAVYLSSDEKNWGEPVATGTGQTTTEITFRPKKARFIAIEQTGPPANAWWTIHKLDIE